jgi:hypothetical protein
VKGEAVILWVAGPISVIYLAGRHAMTLRLLYIQSGHALVFSLSLLASQGLRSGLGFVRELSN